LLGEVIAMRTKNLKSLVVKHFDFLAKEHGFVYEGDKNAYSKKNLSIEIRHENGELRTLFIEKDNREQRLEEVLGQIMGRDFTYPDHFSPWVLSMGDVDSRLAYDAKLIREYCLKSLPL
jgi:hypothetical protein